MLFKYPSQWEPKLTHTLGYLLRKLPNSQVSVCVCVGKGGLCGEGAKERLLVSFHNCGAGGGELALGHGAKGPRA